MGKITSLYPADKKDQFSEFYIFLNVREPNSRFSVNVALKVPHSTCEISQVFSLFFALDCVVEVMIVDGQFYPFYSVSENL